MLLLFFFPLSYGSITWREKKNINVRKFKTAEWQQQQKKINVQWYISVERCGTVYIHLIEMIPGIHYSV